MRIDLSGKTAIITGSTAARRRNSLLHVGLAKRAAGTGVTVNSVLPGPTLTEGAAEMLKEKMAAAQSLKEPMRPSSMQCVRRPSSSGRRASSKSSI
jgi:NAD(P)-dependent dehydrogenase (short-subunit alcohol dehydrogenase family)